MTEDQVTSTHCQRGHLRTAKTTRWYRHKTGRMYPICRRCESIVRNARYKNNPEYRAKVNATSLAWWRAHRAIARQENV